MAQNAQMDVIEEARWLRETVGVRQLDAKLLRVEGEDARTWLNGQITNDVALSQPGDAIYSLVVDVKGKILSDLWVLDGGETFDLVVPSATSAMLLEHFDGYIVMEDVDLGILDAEIATAQGPASSELALDSPIFPCDRLGFGGVDIIAPPADLAERARSLGGGAVGREGWELARHRAGIPAFGLDFDRGNYPQEAGLAERAVSFAKGCYLGQEVVCTLQDRGQLRRQLVHLRAEPGDADPEAGALTLDGAEVGTLRSWVRDPIDGHLDAFAYVKRRHARSGQVVNSAAGSLEILGVIGASPPGDLETPAL